MAVTPSEPAQAVPRLASFPLALIAVAAVQAAAFAPVVVWRFVDIDEGTYLAAAKLVLQGTLPYHDFLYVQMPLLPYVYGAWASIVGENWYLARLLSVAFAIGVGVLLYRHSAARFGTRAAWIGLVLYVAMGEVLAWYPIVKTYALSTFLLFAAYVLVERERVGRRSWIVAGALAGLAVETRLIFLAALPALAWAAARRDGAGRFAVGAALGLTPALLFLALDPRRFVFDNVLYHSTKSSSGLVGDLHQKGETAATLLGIGVPGDALPQFLLLLLAAACAATLMLALERRISLALAIAALLGVASLVPTPTYAQYLCTVVPFLVVAVLELGALISDRVSTLERPLRRGLVVAGGIVLAAYAVLGAADVFRYTNRYTERRVGAVADVAAVVDARTRPGERVLMSWPGFVWATHALPVRGLETDFAPSSAAALTPEVAHRYRMATVQDVERMVAQRETRILVFQEFDVPPPVPDWRRALARGGWRLFARSGEAWLFERRP